MLEAKGRRIVTIAQSVAVVVAVAGMSWLGACDRSEPPPSPPPPPEVTVAKPLLRTTVIWDRYIGRLQAVREVELRARVSGYLESIHFAEGQIVEKGDLLFRIDPRPFDAELARAEATRQEAVARVAQAEASLAQAEAEQRAAQSVLELAQNRLGRVERAAETNAVSQETVDIRSSAERQGEAEAQAAAARVKAAAASVETARAAIATAEALVQSARIDVEFTSIRAPITGRIGARLVHEGNLVQGGDIDTTLLASIVATDPIHCVFDADEQEILKYMRLAHSGKRASSRDVKNPVYVALQDEQAYPHVGHMDFVDNRVDPSTGTLRARAILPNPDGLLIPGLFATLRIPGSGRRDVILVPDEAVVTDQSDQLLYVVGPHDQVERRVVTLGPIVDGLRVIETGLAGDERVVIRGLQRVHAGAAVHPVEEALEALEVDDGLPDDYAPVPRERWLSIDGR